MSRCTMRRGELRNNLQTATENNSVSEHRRSQDFVWGCTFSYQKSWRPFFSRRPQRTSKYTSKSNPPSKNCPKIDSCSGWGCTSCPRRVHLHIFPVNYAWKFFSPPWGVQVHPLHSWLRLCFRDVFGCRLNYDVDLRSATLRKNSNWSLKHNGVR